MSDTDFCKFEIELHSLLLQSHGLSAHMPFYVKTLKDKSNNNVKGFSLSIFSQKEKQIAVLNKSDNRKENKKEDLVYWDKLNRFMYFTRLHIYPEVRKKMKRKF